MQDNLNELKVFTSYRTYNILYFSLYIYIHLNLKSLFKKVICQLLPYRQTHTVQHVNQQTHKPHWVRVNREEVRIQKTRGRRRSAGGTGALANFLRHVCLSMCVLPSQAVLPCNCSKTQPIIFTQLHFFPLRPSKCIEKEWERDRAQEKQKEAERESHMQLRVCSMNEWMYMCVCVCVCMRWRKLCDPSPHFPYLMILEEFQNKPKNVII